jgi:transposase
MIAIVEQMKILLAIEPIDFRKGIDSLKCLCLNHLNCDPYSGTLFVFRNRSATSIKILFYDGSSFWLVLKRLSSGKFQSWPKSSTEVLSQLQARELFVLLNGGNPAFAQFPQHWRKLA